MRPQPINCQDLLIDLIPPTLTLLDHEEFHRIFDLKPPLIRRHSSLTPFHPIIEVENSLMAKLICSKHGRHSRILAICRHMKSAFEQNLRLRYVIVKPDCLTVLPSKMRLCEDCYAKWKTYNDEQRFELIANQIQLYCFKCGLDFLDPAIEES